LRAARDELIQRLFGFLATAERVAYANTRHGCTRVDRFYLPDADAAVAAVLLQHARLAFGEALRQLAAELLQRRIETCVGAPAHVARPIEHFLRAHLQNQVRMRAHEHTVVCHITQDRIELRAVAVLADRIDPDEHTVDPQQLLAHLVSDLVGVARSLDVEADVA
jgi:hypothetical protein